MSKCVPSSSAIVWSMRSWFQRRNSSTPSIVRVGSSVEMVDDLGDRRAGQDALADACASRLRCGAAPPTPHAYVSSRSSSMPLNAAREQRVALAPDRIARVGVRRVLVAENAPRRAYAPRSRPRPRAASCASSGAARREAVKNGSASRSPPHVAACSAHASAWRRAATMPRCDSRRAATLRCSASAVGHARHALASRRPSRRRCRTRMRSKHCAHVLHRAADDPQRRAGPRPRRASSTSRVQPIAHHAGGDPVVVVGPRCARPSAASVSRARSTRARPRPSGEKSVISWSWPGDAGVRSPRTGRARRAARRSDRRCR